MNIPMQQTAESRSCNHCYNLYDFRMHPTTDRHGSYVNPVYACNPCRRSAFENAIQDWLDHGEDSCWFSGGVELFLNTNNLNGAQNGRIEVDPRWHRVVRLGQMKYMSEKDWEELFCCFPPTPVTYY